MTYPMKMIRNLKFPGAFLASYPQQDQPIRFEQLISKSVSMILNLPYFCADDDDKRVQHRVTWLGSEKDGKKAPPGPDAVARCHGFNLLIEATRRTGATQWAHEFASALRHWEEYCNSESLDKHHTYVILVVTELHDDTISSVRAFPRRDFRLIPLKSRNVAGILETSSLAFTMRHCEFRELANEAHELVKSCSSKRQYARLLAAEITKWQRHVLSLEKCAFVGVLSYQAMERIEKSLVSESEIMLELHKKKRLKTYLKKLGEGLNPDIVHESLTANSLAIVRSRTFADECLFERVPVRDFESRLARICQALVMA